MEGVLKHLTHAFLLTIILYILMKYILKQSSSMAMTRSLVIGAAAFIYMVLFGHGLPFRMRNI